MRLPPGFWASGAHIPPLPKNWRETPIQPHRLYKPRRFDQFGATKCASVTASDIAAPDLGCMRDKISKPVNVFSKFLHTTWQVAIFVLAFLAALDT
jgi:hypothetical protein